MKKKSKYYQNNDYIYPLCWPDRLEGNKLHDGIYSIGFT